MNCEDIRELLSAYANEELTPDEREQVAAHLAGCTDCRRSLEEFRDVRRQVESLRITPAAPDATEAVMSRITSGKTVGLFGSWRRRAVAFVPVIAAIVIVLVLQPWNTVLSPQAVLANTHSALETLDSYRVIYRSYRDGNITGERETEYSAPDRYHITETGDKGTTEYIFLGNDLYYRGDVDVNSYQIMALLLSPDSRLFLGEEATLEWLDRLKDIEELPEEDINGVRCIHYRGEYDFEKAIRSQMETQAEQGYPALSEEDIQEMLEEYREQIDERVFELWIGPDDYLLRRVIITAVKSDEELTRVEYVLSGFNEPVSIEAPRDSNGSLLTGWQTTVPDTPVFSSDVQVGFDNYDPVAREINIDVTFTNVSDEAVTNVRANALPVMAGGPEPVIAQRMSGDYPSMIAPGVTGSCTVSFTYNAVMTDAAAVADRIESYGLQIMYQTPDGEYKIETVPFEMPDAFFDLPLTTLASYDLSPVNEYRIVETGASSAWGGPQAEIDGHRYYFVVVNTQNSGIDAPPGILVLDIDDPLHPSRIAYLPASGETRYLGLASLSGTTLYIHADGYLWIVDVSDPSAPREIGKNTQLDISEMVVQEPYGYANVSNEGIVVFDLLSPEAPRSVGALEMTPRANRRLLLHRGYLLVEENDVLYTIDISSPESPEIIDSRSFKLPGDIPAHIGEKTVKEDHAYIILRGDDAEGGILVLDISSPPDYRETAFVEIRNRHIMGSYLNIGDELYIWTMSDFSIDRQRRFDIIDISDPARPVHTGYAFPPDVSTFFDEWDGSGYYSGFREVYDYLYWFIGNSPNQPVIEIFDPEK